MKKGFLCVLLAVGLLLSGCRPFPELHPAAQEYLESFGISESKMLRLNLKKTERYSFDPALSAAYDEIFLRVAISMRIYFDFFRVRNDTPIEYGNYVKISVTVRNAAGKVTHEEKPFSILIGAGCFCEEAEEELIGHCTGEHLAFPAELLYRNLDGTAELTVVECQILQRRPGMAAPDPFDLFCLQTEQFYSDARVEEYTRMRRSFLEHAFECAKFRIDAEELSLLSQIALDEMEREAAKGGLSLKQFLRLCYFQNYEDEMELEECLNRVIDDAEKTIEAVYIVGVLAQKLGLEPAVDAESSDNEMWTAMERYLSLEEAVIRHYSKSVLP